MKKLTLPMLFLIVLFMLFNFLFGKSMELVASGEVFIVKNVEDRFSPSPGSNVGRLVAGDKVKVIGCVNLKDDQVYRVQLESGEAGYATGVNFEILSRPSRDPIRGGVICW